MNMYNSSSALQKKTVKHFILFYYFFFLMYIQTWLKIVGNSNSKHNEQEILCDRGHTNYNFRLADL